VGAKNLSLFHRIGITLVILGMVQSLAPICFRPARSSLRLLERLRVAFSPLEREDATFGLVLNSSVLPPSPEPNRESDQESHDTEDLAETFTWTEAMTDRRSVQNPRAATPLDTLLKPIRDVERTLLGLQRSRSLSILAFASSNLTSRLCRLTC